MTLMPRLALTLFGPFAALLAGHSLRLPTDKTRALLAYLALTPDTPVRRETLAGLLWPDQPETLARQNLRKTVGRLKSVLQAHDPALAEALLVQTKQTIELRSAGCQVDALTFTANLEAVRQHRHPSLGQCETCLARLESSAHLYRQGDLLAGLSLPDAGPFEEWLLMQRESLYQQQLTTLERLSQAYEQHGAFEKARQYALWQIQQEPWREAAHRQLMRLLAAQGLRAEAIAQYQACRRLLQAELAVEPAADTEALLTQIIEGGLPVVPTRTAAARPHAWPRPTGPLVGREAELTRLTQLLADPACRVLTLTGLGGIGKTSLAVAVGEHLSQTAPAWLPDGVYFVPLAEALTTGALAAALAEALGLTLNQRYDLAAQVEQFIRPKALLLILDNLEPAAEVEWLHGLSAAAVQLKLLVTAREPLNWQAEWRYPLEGLAYPPGDENAEQSEAVQFFVQAARQGQPGFAYTAENGPAIARICQLVHGWPLALQMAAGWVRMLSCPAIADQISASLDFLTTSLRGVPPQQRSIRAIFEHTWASLSAAEQSSLAGLAVFHGGFTLPAALAVAGASPLALRSLVEKALLSHDERSGRYHMHELLRQYAREKAQAQPDQARAAQQTHSRFFLQLLQAQGERLSTVQFTAALDVIKADSDNLRQAWLWAAASRQYTLLAGHLEYLARFHERSGQAQEAVALLQQTLELLASGPAQPVELLAEVRSHLAESLLTMGRYAEATAAIATAQAAARALEAVSLLNRLFITQAYIFRERGRYPETHAVLREAIEFSQARHDQVGVARALQVQGNTYWSMAAYDQAQECYEAARAIYQARGEPIPAAVLTGNIGVVLWRQGQYHAALANYAVALEAVRQEGNAARIAVWLGNIGLVYVDLHDDERALAHLDEALLLHDQLGRKFYKLELLLGKVALLLRRGDLAGAAALHQQAAGLAYLIGNRTYLLDCDLWQARLYRAHGRPAAAAELLQSLLRREFRPDAAAAMAHELAQLSDRPAPAR
jgi:DNA-binding SARP family transcriptional activator/predicted ATPase